MPDQILILRETARSGPGPGNGGVVLPAGSKLGAYGDSLTQRISWQPTVCQFFGDIPFGNGGSGSTNAIWPYNVRPPPDETNDIIANDNSSSGSANTRITNFLNNTAGTINTIWFGANDWFNINTYGGPTRPDGMQVGDASEFPKPLAQKNRRTWTGAISYIIERFYTARQTGLHILISPPYMQGAENNQFMADMVRLAGEAAQHHNCPYINLWRDGGINQWNRTQFYNDNVHIDGTAGRLGAKRVANLIIDKIRSYHWAIDLIEPAMAPLVEYEEEPSTAWARELEQRSR